jgi:hypothetical protein
MNGLRFLLLALALGFSGMAQAQQTASVPVADFLNYMNELRDGFRQGKPRPLSSREQDLFDAADRDIRSVLVGKDNIEQLTRRERERLINAQERVTAILTGAEDERVICRRQRSVGTHFQRTTCVTVGQRRQETEDAQTALQRMPQPEFRETPFRILE